MKGFGSAEVTLSVSVHRSTLQSFKWACASHILLVFPRLQKICELC